MSELKTDWVEALRAWTKTSSRECPIEEICETLYAYDQLHARCERLQRDLNDPPADIQQLVIKKLNLVSAEALAAAQAKCERLEADLAIGEKAVNRLAGVEAQCAELRTRLEEARWLIEHMPCDEHKQRRDKWLKGQP